MRLACDPKDHEREFSTLGKKCSEKPTLLARDFEARCDRSQDERLDDQDADDEERDEDRVLSQQVEVDRHPYRNEEQAHEQSLERLDVGLQRVTVFRARQQDACEESTERHRQTGECHQLTNRDDEEEREPGEHLSEPRAGDTPHQWRRHISTDHEHRPDRTHGLEHAEHASVRVAREQWHHCDEGDRGDVLEQEDGERTLPSGVPRIERSFIV